MASIRFADSKLGVEQTREAILSAPIPDGVSGADWTEISGVELSALEKDARRRRRIRGRAPGSGAAEELRSLGKGFRASNRCKSAPANLPLCQLEGQFKAR